jgi:pimeloyl-ACP methyl ester carboxylesterase/DNA-binding CsgD family transcriptional regulator
MMRIRQSLQFLRSSDGVGLAVATNGHGSPIVRAAHWLSHVEHDAASPVWAPWLEAVGRIATNVRYDQRGCGLSDRGVADVSLDRMVDDLAAVIDGLELEQPVLLGMSQGGAIAVRYAARYPDRVAGLVLLGAYARGLRARGGAAEADREAETLVNLVRLGWGRDNPAFRAVFTELFIPGGTPAQHAWWTELERLSAHPEEAARILQALQAIDVTEDARACRVPTLVVHMIGDARVPFEEGRRFATLLPQARFVPLEGRNHVPLAGEPAFDAFMAELRAFLAEVTPQDASGDFADLTAAEAAVLRLVAEGLGNDAIAARLGKSAKTVRNQVSQAMQKIGAPTRAAAVAMARDGLPPG